MFLRILYFISVVFFAIAITVSPPAGISVALAQDSGLCSPATTSDTDNNNLPDCLDACVVELLPDTGISSVGCPDAFKLEAGIGFETEKHQLWYRRFWTGRCIGLNTLVPDFCQNGGFYWAGAMTQALERVDPAKRNGLVTQMWELGELIGQEWARNKGLRAINTAMLRRWAESMRSGEDVIATMQLIGREARDAIRR